MQTKQIQLIESGEVITQTDFFNAHPTVSFPQPLTDAVLADFGARLHVPEAPLEERRAVAWERIKAERDRRKYLGVKVGANWFHSDDPSRIQQLALAMMGAAIPAGLQWKTLTLSPPPVFVTMTPALAAGIFQGTAASDAAVFAAAEAHRVAMEASASPESYDCSVGWPESIEDAQ